MEKSDLRPIYSELQGYLAQAPSLTSNEHRTIYDESVWKQYNEAVAILSKLTQKDYNRFCVAPILGASGRSYYLPLVSYRQKLGGVINAIHAEYFSDEQVPFSGSPSTVISQTQQQGQSLHVQILLDFQGKIDERISNYEEGSKEKTFLEKIKNSLNSTPNVMALFQLIIKTAKDSGLNLGDILGIFF